MFGFLGFFDEGVAETTSRGLQVGERFSFLAFKDD